MKYEHYTRPSVNDIFAGKQSKYALAIAVAKRARQITDDMQDDTGKVYDKATGAECPGADRQLSADSGGSGGLVFVLPGFHGFRMGEQGQQHPGEHLCHGVRVL